MPRLEVNDFVENSEYRSFILSLVTNKMVGGFCIFGGTLESIPIVLKELQVLASHSQIPPLLFSCDCEWGLPMRLNAGGTEFPHLMALENMGDQDGIRKVGKAIGVEMSALGMHWNFAPVADINSNPKNPIINIRAFSGDPEIVAQCTESFYLGLEDAGIISCAKHFPGHGDTHQDSHDELPVIGKSAEEFFANELIPFQRLISKGIPTVMTGHIAAPQLAITLGADSNQAELPATISPFLTEKLLREELGFTGLIITDSLEMMGLQKVISDPVEIALRAFQAGADILLMPTNPVAVYSGLQKAIQDGLITEPMVTEKLDRIQHVRLKYLNSDPLAIVVDWDNHEELAQRSATQSLKVEGSIPSPLHPSSFIIFCSGVEREIKAREEIGKFINTYFPALQTYVITNPGEMNGDDYGANPICIVVHRPRGVLTGDKKLIGIYETVADFISTRLQQGGKLEGLIVFGDPNIAELISNLEPKFTINAFSDSLPSIKKGLSILGNL